MALDDVEKVRGELLHLAVEHLDARHEGIIGHHGRDGGEETKGGRDQGPADGLSDRGQIGVALGVDIMFLLEDVGKVCAAVVSCSVFDETNVAVPFTTST